MKYPSNTALLKLLDDAWDNEKLAWVAPRPASAKAATDSGLGVTVALNATHGKWEGSLEYRDYQSNQWFELPVKISIVSQPDGITSVRTAEYDDGPQTGIVWITTLQQVDATSKKLSYAQMRKGRPLDSGIGAITSFSARDLTHWTLVVEETRGDGDGTARVRETTTRDGNAMVTLKEVDPEGDGKAEWLPRNRTTLKLVQ